MIAPLRRTHRATWIALCICLPVVFLAAVSMRPPSLQQLSGPTSQLCWETLCLAIGTTPVEVAGAGGVKRNMDSEAYLAPAGTRVTHLELREPSRHPALAAYWVPGFVLPAEGLPSNAQHLAPISVGNPAKIDHPSTPEHGATIAFYSLARDETIEVIHLQPIGSIESASP